MMEEGASGRMGKTGQIRAGGGKKGRVNEVVVGADKDNEEKQPESFGHLNYFWSLRFHVC